jgi:hypothetical protein
MLWAHLATWLVLGVVLGVVIAVGVIWLQRMSLLWHRSGTFTCRIGATPVGPWRPGLAQYSADKLSWWPRYSLGGGEHWSRTSLTVVSRSELPPGGPTVVLTCCVDGDGGPQTLFLALGVEVSAGFTSWIEATPRRPDGVI